MAGDFNLMDHIPVSVPAVRTIEVITEDILRHKSQAGESILSIGACLNEAKAILTHGEWLPWLTEQVEFSERTAQRFMRLANEWTNPTALSDLGASKALSLLAIPAADRDAFIDTPHEVNGREKLVIDMTSRELEQAIKAQKAAEKKAEGLQNQLDAQQKDSEEKLAEADKELAARIREVNKLQKELKDLKAKPVEVAVMEVDAAAIETAKAEAVAEMQAKLEKAQAAADKAKAKQKEAEAAKLAAEEKLAAAAKAGKRESIAADEDLTMFRVVLEGVVEQVNKLHGMIIKVRGKGREDDAQKLCRALAALAEQVRRAAE